jgi:hypothetical protein
MCRPRRWKAERLGLQKQLVDLSSNGKQVVVDSDHNMHLSAPNIVSAVIDAVVQAIRKDQPLSQTG